MPEARSFAVPPRLIMAGPLAIPPAVEARVAVLWAEAIATRPTLFDGPILSLVRLDDGGMMLASASYRHLIAGRLDADIAAALALRPLAVSGLLCCRDGIVFGRRSGDVTQGRGLWELVPSGGVEAPPSGAPPDLAAEIGRELEEELGLHPAQVDILSPIGVVQDEGTGVVDIVIPLRTALGEAEVRALHASRGSREYSEIHVSPTPAAFVERADVMPESRLVAQSWAAAGDSPA